MAYHIWDYYNMMGSGGAFDYDNDSYLDIYLVKGYMLGPGKTPADAFFLAKDPAACRPSLSP